jgi:membrane protein implicated in regulation of membrane protease activity
MREGYCQDAIKCAQAREANMSLDQAFFLAVALFGALFLFVSFLVGQVGEFFDDVGDLVGDHLDAGADGAVADHGEAEGPSPLSLRNLMAFMTAYGASGLITSASGWSTVASSLFAIIPGFALAFVAYKFMQLLYSQQSSSVVEIAGLVGRSGIVDLTIPAAGLGRVTLNTGAGQGTFLARAENGGPLPTGRRVVVTGSLGSDLIVAPAPGDEQAGAPAS